MGTQFHPIAESTRSAGELRGKSIMLPILAALALACSSSPTTLEPSGSGDGVALEPKNLAVTPSAVVLSGGDTVRFSAKLTGNDRNGVVRWHASGGTISDDGTYIAGNRRGKYRVIAESTEATDTATVEISDAQEPDPVVSVHVVPSEVQVSPSGRVQFTVELKDSAGNPVNGEVEWHATGGLIDGSGSYVAGSEPGLFTVSAAHAGGLSAQAAVTIRVDGAVPASLVLTPADAELEPGSVRQFSAVAFDQDGKAVGAEISWTATGGSIDGAGLYVAGTTNGTFDVVARTGSIADTSTVSISSPPPATVARVEVAPTRVEIVPGGTQQFTARLFDSGSREISGMVEWSSTGGTITPDGTYGAGNVAGAFRVIARSADGPSDTADVAILAQADSLTLVFADGFESGNHHEWRDPDPLGGNNPPGEWNPIDFTSQVQPRTGGYGYAFYGIERGDPLVQAHNLSDVDRISLKLLHWGPWAAGGPHLYSAWYYWPGDYNVHDAVDPYTNIMQWKGRGRPDWNPTWIVAVSGHSRTQDRIVLHDWQGRMTGQETHSPPTPVLVPKDRWFRLTVLYVPDWQHGTIRVWLDDDLIMALDDVPTLAAGYADRDLMWGIGNYGGAALGEDGDTSRGFYVDDVNVWRVEP